MYVPCIAYINRIFVRTPLNETPLVGLRAGAIERKRSLCLLSTLQAHVQESTTPYRP